MLHMSCNGLLPSKWRRSRDIYAVACGRVLSKVSKDVANDMARSSVINRIV
jgi:hypothetical protein